MRRAFLVWSCFIAVLCVLSVQAQESIASRAEAANAAYASKDWAKAEPLYERLTLEQPNNARNFYRLGVSLQGLGQHEKALGAFQKAQAKGARTQNVEYGLAGVYASMGDKSHAIEHLGASIKQGWSQPDSLTSDPDLQALRSDPGFAPLVEQAKHNQTPCAYTAENRQFDFWVGDWDVVTTQDGVPAGVSHIERTIGDCVIWENWTSLGATGYSGKSYNTYNSSLKRWEQFWVDNIGGMVHFYGGLQNGVMDFFTDATPQPDGTKAKRHLQFFRLGPDRVRQFSQMSSDEGKTWTVEYDLTYNRKK